MKPTVYVDVRSLQDPLYQFRGVGQHVSSLVRSRRNGPAATWKLVGLVDEQFGDLPAEYASLMDEIDVCRNPPIRSTGAVFIDPSPMTHDQRFSQRFVGDPFVLNVAVIHDFIPFDWPGYFPSPASRIAYLAKILRLRSFDLFTPVSSYSGWRLEQILGVAKSRMAVTGAAVRSNLYDVARRLLSGESARASKERYFFSVGGGDRRKNTEAAVAAVHLLRQSAEGSGIRLKVLGHYDPSYKADLLRTAGHAEGDGFLEFYSGIDDETLATLYAGAIATIVPSHIEGFSLPVVESAVCGTPTLASTCGAHLELIDQPEALFPSTDHEGLAAKLREVLRRPELRESLIRAQQSVGPKFHETAVGGRFWDAVTTAMSAHRNIAVTPRARKPRIAFLSPYPPEQSGVARYTQQTLEAAAEYFDIDLYTNAARPLFSTGRFRDAGPIGPAALLKGAYDAIISVIGNSHFHIPIFKVFEEYGGPCILHDSRLTQIYHWRFGRKRFIAFASKLLGRPVSDAEVETWLQDRDVPSLFLEPILTRANPLVVHTRLFQELIEQRYGARAELATFCPNLTFVDAELQSEARLAARGRLGISPDTFVVSTFGYVSKVKAMDSCIIAAEMLRGWNIGAQLYFVGSATQVELSEVRQIANAYGVAPYVHASTEFVSPQRYRDFMLASDAAIQLRTYGYGQPSAALADCISAGLPSVANRELALSCDAPGYVLTVPDAFSPLQIAEQLATIYEQDSHPSSNLDARREYLSTHNFGCYARRLREILGLV